MPSDLTTYRVRYKPAILPASPITDNTALVSLILDTLGFGANALAIMTGTLADADATFALTIAESDNADMSSSNAVASGDLIGTLAGASFKFSDDNRTFKIGYKGAKRYLQATITPSNNSASAPIVAMWVQGSPQVIPLTDQAV